LAEVLVVALLTALTTGLGVAPFAFFTRTSERWPGIATAAASGMMLSASVFALADKALRLGNAFEVVAGMLAGAAFFAWTARLVVTRHWRLADWSAETSRQSIVIIGTMFVHIGHMDFPGCFRCHDDSHKSRDGKTISQECDSCHKVE
jgi:zinc transporter ZupT